MHMVLRHTPSKTLTTHQKKYNKINHFKKMVSGRGTEQNWFVSKEKGGRGGGVWAVPALFVHWWPQPPHSACPANSLHGLARVLQLMEWGNGGGGRRGALSPQGRTRKPGLNGCLERSGPGPAQLVRGSEQPKMKRGRNS